IVNGASTLAGGLMLLPGSVIFSLMTPYFGHLYDEKGAKLPLYLGGTFLLIAVILLAILGMKLNPWLVGIIYSLLTCGMRMAFNNTLTLGIESSPKQLHADATAIMQTGQQFAGSIGTSVLAAIISFSQSTSHGSKAFLMAQGCEVAFIFVTFIAILIMICYWRLFTKVN
ncbi:MFS transporter, partial [Sphingomonas zeae]